MKKPQIYILFVTKSCGIEYHFFLFFISLTIVDLARYSLFLPIEMGG